MLAARSNPKAFHAIVLVESALIKEKVLNEHYDEQSDFLGVLMMLTNKRKDTWNSREEALQFFHKRLPWIKWDKRVLDLFLVCSICATSEVSMLISSSFLRNLQSVILKEARSV